MPNPTDTSMATASVASTVQSWLAPPSSANRSDTSSPIATNRAAAAHDSARAAEHICLQQQRRRIGLGVEHTFDYATGPLTCLAARASTHRAYTHTTVRADGEGNDRPTWH